MPQTVTQRKPRVDLARRVDPTGLEYTDGRMRANSCLGNKVSQQLGQMAMLVDQVCVCESSVGAIPLCFLVGRCKVPSTGEQEEPHQRPTALPDDEYKYSLAWPSPNTQHNAHPSHSLSDIQSRTLFHPSLSQTQVTHHTTHTTLFLSTKNNTRSKTPPIDSDYLAIMPSFTATIFALTTLLAATHASAIPRDTASDAIGAIRSGSITYYNTQGGVGACGTTLSDSEPMVALSATLYDQCTFCPPPRKSLPALSSS